MLLACIIATFLQTAELEIGGKMLIVEIVDTPKTRKKGLMGRSDLAEGKGMLFIFEEPSMLSFWMKNTHIPLSIGFFDEEKRLINTAEMPPSSSGTKRLPCYESLTPAQYALEASPNWFKKNNIKPGMKFTLHDRVR